MTMTCHLLIQGLKLIHDNNISLSDEHKWRYDNDMSLIYLLSDHTFQLLKGLIGDIAIKLFKLSKHVLLIGLNK